MLIKTIFFIFRKILYALLKWRLVFTDTSNTLVFCLRSSPSFSSSCFLLRLELIFVVFWKWGLVDASSWAWSQGGSKNSTEWCFIKAHLLISTATSSPANPDEDTADILWDILRSNFLRKGERNWWKCYRALRRMTRHFDERKTRLKPSIFCARFYGAIEQNCSYVPGVPIIVKVCLHSTWASPFNLTIFFFQNSKLLTYVIWDLEL